LAKTKGLEVQRMDRIRRGPGFLFAAIRLYGSRPKRLYAKSIPVVMDCSVFSERLIIILCIACLAPSAAVHANLKPRLPRAADNHKRNKWIYARSRWALPSP
jgi:hypothetical protein